MPRYRRQNIDRKTNKPELKNTVSNIPDPIFNRANEVRRDDDVVRTPRRTVYNIDFAIKWFIENEIQPQIEADGEVIDVPVIFANGEKWDNVRRLGYLRDQKGMLQSPIIVLKRNSLTERDELKKLDINYPKSGNQITYKKKYNKRNTYLDELFPLPLNTPAESEELYVINVPEYVEVGYDMMVWTDFTTQMNDLVEQIMPYGGFAWGNEFNKYKTYVRDFSFETINTVGEDRLIRCTVPLTVQGTLLGEQEFRQSVVQKRYSIKKLSWATVIDTDTNIFDTTIVPQQLIDAQQSIISGNSIIVSGGGDSITIDATTLNYLINLSDKTATIVDANTVTISAAAAENPVIGGVATKNEFDVYINGQYIDKAVYTWTPTDSSTQTIEFNSSTLGYSIVATDIVIVNGRWA